MFLFSWLYYCMYSPDWARKLHRARALAQCLVSEDHVSVPQWFGLPSITILNSDPEHNSHGAHTCVICSCGLRETSLLPNCDILSCVGVLDADCMLVAAVAAAPPSDRSASKCWSALCAAESSAYSASHTALCTAGGAGASIETEADASSGWVNSSSMAPRSFSSSLFILTRSSACTGCSREVHHDTASVKYSLPIHKILSIKYII